MQRIRKGDEVIVITGRDKGKKGTVTAVHDRVGYKVVDGKKVRVFKSDGAVVGAKA